MLARQYSYSQWYPLPQCLYWNSFTMNAANKARTIITIAPRNITIHFSVFTMYCRLESALSQYFCTRLSVPPATNIRSSIWPTIGTSGMMSTGLMKYKAQSAAIIHAPVVEGRFLSLFIIELF